MRTEELIQALAEDEVKPVAYGLVFRAALAAGIITAAVIFFGAIGFRPDIGAALETARFLFKFVVTGTLAVLATLLLQRMGRPGRPLGLFGYGLIAVPVMIVAAAAFELAAMPRALWGQLLVGSNARFCLTLIPLMAVGPLALFIAALRRGAPARPGLAGAVAGLAASGIAATFYAANCTDDSPLFVMTWYPLATAIVVATGAFAGARFLRW